MIKKTNVHMAGSHVKSTELKKAKKEMRNRMLEYRRGIAPKRRMDASEAIRSNIVESDFFKRAKCVFCFYSMDEEVDTHKLLDDIVGAGKCAVIPYIVSKGIMNAVQYSSSDDLSDGAYGIPTVRQDRIVIIQPDMIDLVIVPGAAFDKFGGRLGLGAGFYDRFLRQDTAGAYRAAIAFSGQLVDNVPMEPHDCYMDAVVTEDGLFYCHR